MQAEHLKSWIVEERVEENPDPYKWQIVVDIIHMGFAAGELATEWTWSTIALLPKGGGKWRRIILVEVLWKLISAIIDRHLADSINFHDILNGFRA